MVNHFSDEGIRGFLLEHLPKVTSFFKKVNVSDDEALQDIFESEDLASLVNYLSSELNIDCENFNMLRYFPWNSESIFDRHPDNTGKAPLSLRMFVESVKAGRWLYD